jgi:hypothetical protein
VQRCRDPQRPVKRRSDVHLVPQLPRSPSFSKQTRDPTGA